jgi:hypothetical protein
MPNRALEMQAYTLSDKEGYLLRVAAVNTHWLPMMLTASCDNQQMIFINGLLKYSVM